MGQRCDDLQMQPGFDLDSKSLQVSPAMFAPGRLCSCNPGWSLGCLGGGSAVQDTSLDVNTVELQGNYRTDMPRLQSACFHSDLLRISIFSASLAHPKEGHWCHL